MLEEKYNPVFFICAVQDELGYMSCNALFSGMTAFNLLSVDDTCEHVCVPTLLQFGGMQLRMLATTCRQYGSNNCTSVN